MLGLLSSGHCIGMCGGITAALTFGIVPDRRSPLRLMTLTFGYNIGRIMTYTLMGFLLGTVAYFLQNHSIIFMLVFRTLAGLMLIMMGLYLSNLWYGLIWLEKGGQRIWQIVQPFSKKYIPVVSVKQAVTLGMLWGFLPCGLVYSVLVWAISAPNNQTAATIMLCFGLGTLPALVTLGVFSNLLKKWIQAKITRLVSGILVIAFGVWTLWPVYQHVGMHHEHVDHMQPTQTHYHE
jgi:hypothetical protein